MDAKELFVGMSDEALLESAQAVLEIAHARNLEIPGYAGTVALEGAQSEAETPATERVPLTAESLLATFDDAYQTYGFLVDSANGARAAAAKGRKKPEQLKVIDVDTVRADVEALLANKDVIQELQAEIDYFTQNPETGSPEAGFDLRIVPEGLTDTDEQAIARDVQAKIPTEYPGPYIRPQAYNDKRAPVVTGKGFRLVFAPRHYNVPRGIPANQTRWMKAKNQTSSATELQTATDGEALAFINGLADNGELNNTDTRFDQTYFRRSDQTPHGGDVSVVCVYGYGRLLLDRSNVCYDRSTRALVVPKLKA